MAKVINLNRFKKRRAKEEKEREAERNRRYHGRTKAERLTEALTQRQLQARLEGALLVPERVSTDQLQDGSAADALSALEQASKAVLSLSEFAERLRREGQASSAVTSKESPAGGDDPDD
ncbi:MAG TPA: DUF4169 family protein [Polyangiaceae bacterium]|nr:DUF4169 family protein [Polyangiaceae bacterium]